MSMFVYNTITNSKEAFKPEKPGEIGIYACGVTVYDLCHIGHAMQAIIYDVMRKYFVYLGNKVTYVRNFTDVDDKIINRAAEKNMSALELSDQMIQAHTEDLAMLGVKPADIEPRVSTHIPEIIAMIEDLIQKDAAYAVEGDVYFKVSAFANYGKLSNRDPDDMRAGARVEVNPKKEDPLDFALWKAVKPGEISWDSPWGQGRPGWHIECSAMALKNLGKSFDIHGGGKDLIFPHHENEIAQSEASNGCAFGNYWIHNGLVTVEGRKMAKSANNFLSIRDAVDKYYPETIRYTILKHHYSSNIDFCEKNFYDAYSRLFYFYNTLAKVGDVLAAAGDYPETIPPGIQPPDVEAAFQKAMNDDFNTAIAVRELGLAFKFLNDLLAAKKPKLKQKLHTMKLVYEPLKRCMAVLGLTTKPPQEALDEIQAYLVKQKNIDTTRVAALVEQRNTARAEKDWARADEIRDELAAEGISIMDTPTGTRWQVQP